MPETKKQPVLQDAYPFYLANKAVFKNKKLAVTNKYTGEIATHCAQADASDINVAIDAAVKAAPALQAMPSWKKKEILMKCVEAFKENHESFSQALAVEAGKPIKDARGEVTRLIDTFTIAAEEAVRIGGEYMPLDISERASGLQSIVRKFPIGPVSMISPFNFPLNLAAHKIAPAIAVGCPWVMKPASRTPIGALMIAEVLSKLDLPEGAFSVLPCSRDGADLFTTDDRLKLLSFTGSPDVGWDLKARCGKKKCVLELGGNAACVVCDTDNMDHVVNRVVFGGYYQSGQSCISTQRVMVHESIYDQFKAKYAAAVKALKMGDPLEEDTFIGPIIAESEAKRIEKWVDNAKAKGATILAGGKRNGVMYEATLVENCPKDTELVAEEVFGPVTVLSKFSDFKKCIDEVNDSKFGLQAGIFTSDINKAFYAYEHLDVGGVLINEVPSVRVDSQPYGGVKDSGIGREGIRWAMHDMQEERILMLKNIGQL